MGDTVILSVQDGEWNRWGEQFVKRQPTSRRQLLISPSPTVAEAKTRLIEAINATGSGGTLIVSVGHAGVGALPGEGMVELAPGGALRLGGMNASVPPNFVSVFYDVNVAGPPSTSDLDHDLKENPRSVRLAHWRIYQEIATAFRTTKPYEVVLLSCNVGNARDFIRKIANDWQVIIRAYTVQVGIDTNRPRFEVFLANHPPPFPTAAEMILHEEELPYAPADTIRIGPPP